MQKMTSHCSTAQLHVDLTTLEIDLLLEIISNLPTLKDIQNFLALNRRTKSIIKHKHFEWAVSTALSSSLGSQILVFERLPYVASVLQPPVQENHVYYNCFLFDIKRNFSETNPLAKTVISTAMALKNVVTGSESCCFGICFVYVDGLGFMHKVPFSFHKPRLEQEVDALQAYYKHLTLPPAEERFIKVKSYGCLMFALSRQGDLWTRGITEKGGVIDDDRFVRHQCWEADEHGMINSSLGKSRIKDFFIEANRSFIILENGAVFVFGSLTEFIPYQGSAGPFTDPLQGVEDNSTVTTSKSKKLSTNGLIEITNSRLFGPRFVKELLGEEDEYRKRAMEKEEEAKFNKRMALDGATTFESSSPQMQLSFGSSSTSYSSMVIPIIPCGRYGQYGIFGTHKPAQYISRMDAFLTSDGVPIVKCFEEDSKTPNIFYTPLDRGRFFHGESVVMMAHHVLDAFLTDRGRIVIVRGIRGLPTIEKVLCMPVADFCLRQVSLVSRESISHGDVTNISGTVSKMHCTRSSSGSSHHLQQLSTRTASSQTVESQIGVQQPYTDEITEEQEYAICAKDIKRLILPKVSTINILLADGRLMCVNYEKQTMQEVNDNMDEAFDSTEKKFVIEIISDDSEDDVIKHQIEHKIVRDFVSYGMQYAFVLE
ncbi:uncharacterized protein MONOS_6306 [Monocercomonoides exilis]|uniref:uncharacterized protein n=1 Tax=Monocercomonoides exilis TaxID=2049356 RepID=UPI00355AAF18|nr:hypothetical protein MONOS_6306 [Monocercomonoides exilis]